MVAYLQRRDADTVPAESKPAGLKPAARHALARDMFHGLTPEEFHTEAQSVADAEAVTPQVRARLRTQLVERLKTPIDTPSWGPDWIKQGGKPPTERKEGGLRPSSLFPRFRRDEDALDNKDGGEEDAVLDDVEQDDALAIARNMEEPAGLAFPRPVSAGGGRGDRYRAARHVRRLSDHPRRHLDARACQRVHGGAREPAKHARVQSLQVASRASIIHFMLKITGVHGRNAMVTAAFVFALVMIGCLGYLVAYNNMSGGTSVTLEHPQDDAPGNNAIDRLFASMDRHGSADEATDQPGARASWPPA